MLTLKPIPSSDPHCWPGNESEQNERDILVIEFFFFWPADLQVSTYFQGVSVVVAVNGNVQDVGIVVKDLLGSITVMDVLNLLASKVLVEKW